MFKSKRIRELEEKKEKLEASVKYLRLLFEGGKFDYYEYENRLEKLLGRKSLDDCLRRYNELIKAEGFKLNLLGRNLILVVLIIFFVCGVYFLDLNFQGTTVLDEKNLQVGETQEKSANLGTENISSETKNISEEGSNENLIEKFEETSSGGEIVVSNPNEEVVYNYTVELPENAYDVEVVVE